MKNKPRLVSHGRKAILAALIAAFVFLVVPTQTYLGSPDLFDFSYAQLFGAGLVGTVVLAVACFVFLWLLERLVGALALVLGLALLTCLYLETGLFSIGLPALNGVNGFANLIRGGADAVAWLAVIVVFIFLRASAIRSFKWVVLSLAILIVASVFDAGGGAKVSVSSPLADGFYSTYDVVKNIRFSTNRNVMVFILDMTPATIMTDVVERNPELKSKFPGFTCFRRNLGMHDETAYGLPGLMTGRYFGSNTERGSYGMSVFGEESFLSPYVAASNDVYFAGALHSFGYTNRLKKYYSTNGAAAPREQGCIFNLHATSIPNLRLRDAMVIRLSPYLLKGRFFGQALASAAAFRPATPSTHNEGVVYSAMAESEQTDSPLVLSVVHTDALHWPISYDRKGRRLPKPLTIPDGGLTGAAAIPYRDAMREAGVYVLMQLGELFDIFRTKGLYDNSTIILAADHGCSVMKEGQNNGAESSILWVKPERSRADFRFSDAPTTNAKIYDVVCNLMAAPLDLSRIESLLSAQERIFRAEFHGVTLHALGGELHYKDWVYGPDSQLKELKQH